MKIIELIATKYRTIPIVLANYLVVFGVFFLLRVLPPEFSYHLDKTVICIFFGLIVTSLVAVAKIGRRAFCFGLTLLLPLAGILLLFFAAHRPAEISERLDWHDESLALYSLLDYGFLYRSQIICVQRSFLSGCEVIDSWETRWPCQGVLELYLNYYKSGDYKKGPARVVIADEHRRKCLMPG